MLFPLYTANPATIDSYADALVKQATAVNGVNVNALKGKAKAAENVDGELEDLLDEPFQHVGNNANKIALAAGLAAGSLYRWSTGITTFNNGVEKLNKEYEDAKTNHFGVPDAPAGPSGGISPGELQAQHDRDVAGKDAALKAKLQNDWEKLDDALDLVASNTNTDLSQGATPENVLALFADGSLPQTAFPLLTALGIDPGKVSSVLKDLRTFLKESQAGRYTEDRRQAWANLLQTIKGLDPEAAAVILGAMSDEEIKALGEEVTGDSGSVSGATDFYSFILAGATQEQVDRLRNIWTLNPDGGENWQRRMLTFGNGLKPGVDGGTFAGAAQGQFNDCWMLAKLNALTGADPNWPQEHVRDNFNGTVSVKFYNDNGDPYWVTVTDDLPSNGARPDGPNSSTWAAYYEKAMALDEHSPDGLMAGDGYDGLTAGFSDTADVYMTGKDSDSVKFTGLDVFSDPYDAAVQAHDDNKGVVASNWSNDGYPWPTGDDKLKQYHVYYVKDILPNGDVVMGNPWGVPGVDDNGKSLGPYDVTLTKDQFNDYFEDVSVVNQ